MSLIKFGQYFGDVPDLTIGADLEIDGHDGFEDQTLWYYKKGDQLTFIINPKEEQHLLQHTIVQVEFLKDTETNDYTYTKIISINTVDNFFHKKHIKFDNDFLKLVEYYSFIWAKTLESKQRHPHTDYKEYEPDFLSYSELNEVVFKGHYSTTRRLNDKTRIYAEILSDNKTIRVITVGGGVPDTCFLYDINDVELYKKVLAEKSTNSIWSDEKKWWAEMTK